MLVPVRCFTCGKVLANKWEYYMTRLREERFKKEIDLADDEPEFLDLSLPELEKTIIGKLLDELGLIRYCCRTTMFTCIDLSEEISY
jgi:DNA-directed RNA polymerase I, II, and III subunit RPABC5